jgi:hypothetical protein
MFAACFGLYLGHPQACQYKSHTNEDKIKTLKGVLLKVTIFIMLKHNIYNIKVQITI